ncbi:DUF2252 domain-containing protein [Xylanimonas sp. McL0601]|uniref:DUF2252 domain-containing protein n=1 Tax=Xylanimonas sp. McL0601 TaxID=3414739 RepID=UPI003CE9880A
MSTVTAPRPDGAERAAAGKLERARVPLQTHAEFRTRPADVALSLVLGQDSARLPELVPVRHERMVASPFTFYRGAALVMAADLAATPTTSLHTQLCGDAHLSNFGAYASPERQLVMDLNDFDETYPGPFEWDVKRMAASFVVAGRENGFPASKSRAAALASVSSYRTAMRTFAEQPFLAVWYANLPLEETLDEYVQNLDPRELKRRRDDLATTRARIASARSRDSMQALRKLSTVVDGRRCLVSDPPLIVRLDDLADGARPAHERVEQLLADYRATVRPDLRHLLEQFDLVDAARKVVGVGSVGMRAWVLLLQGPRPDDVLLLQGKQAGRSVLAEYVKGPEYESEGERVVLGQRMMQAASDIFLGWIRSRPDDIDAGQHYYLRQLRDWKLSAEVERMRPTSLRLYATICGWTLARAHARSGDRIALAAYLGKSDAFEEAVADFAEACADQNERDHAAFAAAVRSGAVAVEPA